MRRATDPRSEMMDRRRAEPGVMPAGRGLVVILVTLLSWSLLFAPRLEEAALAHDVGARRSAALIVLRPLAAVSDAVGLSAATELVERAIGLDPDAAPGEDDLPVDPLPDVDASPPPPPDDPTVDTPAPIRTPTPSRKLRVAIVGDSLAAGLGYFAGRVFDPDLVRITRQGRISTGLARPDYFDWPSAMGEIVAGFDPDLVIVMIGENDGQHIRSASGRIEALAATTAWPPAYERKVIELMSVAISGDARVVWVGLPVIRDRGKWSGIERRNAIYEEAAAAIGDVEFLDAWELFDAPDGGYTAYRREEGNLREVRTPDGVHFTPIGYTILVREVARLATREFGLDPATYGRTP
jgi:hypothetical protein